MISLEKHPVILLCLRVEQLLYSELLYEIRPGADPINKI